MQLSIKSRVLHVGVEIGPAARIRNAAAGDRKCANTRCLDKALLIVGRVFGKFH